MALNHAELETLVQHVQPALLNMYGIGPVLSAIILTAWSHPGRVRSEAAFAALAGTCPVPASSGSNTRFRLNRGGDRQLNKAIYTVALTRMNSNPATRDCNHPADPPSPPGISARPPPRHMRGSSEKAHRLP